MSDHYTLITGASSGIGLALAKQYAINKHPLILVARSGEKLQEIAIEFEKKYHIPVAPITLDLTAPGAPETLYNSTVAQGMTVQTVINNAGFATYGPFHQVELNRQLNLLDLNMRVLTEISHRFIPHLAGQAISRLVNVASTAGFMPGPTMATYYASKAYVLSLSEALAEEYRTTPLAVCCLCPGTTDTDFAKKANVGRARLFQGKLMTVEQVAAYAYIGIQNGDPVIIPGFMNKVSTWLPRCLPRNVISRLVAGANEQA